MGISAVGRPGNRLIHIFRDTSRWSLDTALTYREKRMARAGIQKMSFAAPTNACPASSSKDSPRGPNSGSRYFLTMAVSKFSLPAITGVWVVNTVDARIRALASEKPRPLPAMRSWSRATTRSAEWPSLMW